MVHAYVDGGGGHRPFEFVVGDDTKIAAGAFYDILEGSDCFLAKINWAPFLDVLDIRIVDQRVHL